MRKKEYPYQNLSLEDMKGEEWEDIPGFEDEYQLSNYGRLKSQARWVDYKRFDVFRPARIRKLQNTGSKKRKSEGLQMKLHKDGKRYYFSVARFVYHLFVSSFDLEDHSVVVSRKDGDILNCRSNNLVLRTISNIVKEGYALNKRKSPFQLQIKPVLQYDENGKRIANYASTRYASLATHIAPRLINAAAQKKNSMAGGFFWRYGKSNSDIKIIHSKRHPVSSENIQDEKNSVSQSLKNLPGEHWKPVKGFEGLYEVSDCGRVKSLRRLKNVIAKNKMPTKYWTPEFIMKQSVKSNHNGKDGYPFVNLKKDGAYTTFIIARLVYETFGIRKNEMAGKRIVHADGNIFNNHISNLKPTTQSEILKESYKNQRRVSHFASLPPKQRKKYTLQTAEINKKQITQYDLNGKHITSFNSIAEAADAVGLDSATISNAANGRLYTAGGFVWRKGKAKIVDMKSFWENKRIQLLQKRGQKVTQYDLNGKRIACYPAIAEAVRTTRAGSGEICNVIKGKQRTAGGFIWKKGEGPPIIDVSNFVYGGAWRGQKQQKKVEQYTVAGKYIRTFDSIKAAAESIGVHATAVSVALSESHRTCKGYKWCYA